MSENKQILILKTGHTIAGLLDAGEDFEDWFIDCSGLKEELFITKSLHLEEDLIDLGQIRAIIVTGSPAYITDEASWNFIAANYIKEAHQLGIPILGVCYGHQLLAWTFGGKVDFNANGRSIGTIQINLTELAKRDHLFKVLPERFSVHVSHQQSVVKLPADAVKLASGHSDIVQAFRLGNKTWGVQFHPEFSKRIMQKYIDERRITIEEEGLDPVRLSSQVSDTPRSAYLFRNFCQLAMDNNLN